MTLDIYIYILDIYRIVNSWQNHQGTVKSKSYQIIGINYIIENQTER